MPAIVQPSPTLDGDPIGHAAAAGTLLGDLQPARFLAFDQHRVDRAVAVVPAESSQAGGAESIGIIVRRLRPRRRMRRRPAAGRASARRRFAARRSSPAGRPAPRGRRGWWPRCRSRRRRSSSRRAAMAWTTPTELARSLNEAVGLRPSSFTRSCPTPSSRASRGEVEDRRPADRPALRNGGRVERQQLAVAPVVQRPAGRAARPATRPARGRGRSRFRGCHRPARRRAGHLAPGVGGYDSPQRTHTNSLTQSTT